MENTSMENNGFNLEFNGDNIKNKEVENTGDVFVGSTVEPVIPKMDSPIQSGLTMDEEKDPNRIQVVISDPAPVIILFGARASGKTMTLVRLTRWLKANGYQVEPERNFRPSNSEFYRRM